MKFGESNRFARAEQEMEARLERAPRPGPGGPVALDVHGQVKRREGRPAAVVVFGEEHLFEPDGQTIFIAGFGYHLVELRGREALVPLARTPEASGTDEQT